jgi:hypothetical protein
MTNTPLPFDLSFEDRKHYAYAQIKAANIDRAMAFTYLGDVVLMCADIKQKKLLIERDIPILMNDDDMAQALAKLLLMGSGMKIAILNKNRSIGKELKRAVGQVCGKDSHCKYFNSLKAAERWLLR